MNENLIRRFAIYLPPHYERSTTRYPVAFVLGGWGSKSWGALQDASAFGIPLSESFDQAIQRNEMPAFVGIFPDATTRFGGSQYINSPAFGHFSDFICDELVEWVDKNLRTENSPDRRIICGHSSGGFGALINASLRPDRFLYVGSAAADTYFEVLFFPLIRIVCEEVEKAGGLENFIKSFLDHPNPLSAGRSKGEAMMALCMASCFAPNVSNPPIYGDLFFDLKTGAILPEVWERYLSWDPLHFLPRHEENLRQLKYVYLDHGRSDEYGLQYGQRQLAQILQKFKVPHELNEHPGGHSGQSWRYLERIKKLLQQMNA